MNLFIYLEEGGHSLAVCSSAKLFGKLIVGATSIPRLICHEAVHFLGAPPGSEIKSWPAVVC